MASTEFVSSKSVREMKVPEKDIELLKAAGYELANVQEKLKSIFETVFLQCDEAVRQKKPAELRDFSFTIGVVQVSFSLINPKCYYNCEWCKHTTSSPRKYRILNTLTGEFIDRIDDHSLHQIDRHGYFGYSGWRVDPVLLARVIFKE